MFRLRWAAVALGTVVFAAVVAIVTYEASTGVAVDDDRIVVGLALGSDLVFCVDVVIISVLREVFEAVEAHLLVADPRRTLEVTATQGARDAVLLPVRALGITLVVVTLEWAVRRFEHCMQGRFTGRTSEFHGNSTSR